MGLVRLSCLTFSSFSSFLLFDSSFICLICIERKIANLTNEQLLNLSRLDDVEEEDEDEVSTPEAEPVAVAITVRYHSPLFAMLLYTLIYLPTD